MIGCGGIVSMPESAGLDRSLTPFSKRSSEDGPCGSRRHQAEADAYWDTPRTFGDMGQAG